MTEQAPVAETDAEPPGQVSAFDGPDWAPGSFGPADPIDGSDPPPRRNRVKISRRARRVLRRRRRIGYVMVLAGALILLPAAWIVITALMARSQLDTVRTDVRTLRGQIAAGDLAGARVTAVGLGPRAERAHRLTTGPAWAVAARIPGAGDPLKTVRGITTSVDQLSRNVLPPLVSATRELDPSTVRNSDGTLDLARIAGVAPELDRAGASTARATAAVSGLPGRTWLPIVDRTRTDLLAQLTGLNHTLGSADLAARIAPTMLGQAGPKTYLVSFETEAELRGTGGLPGAFAIVRADRGKLSFVRFETDSVLVSTRSGLDLGPQFDQLYHGANATDEYGDSNVSPNFPYAAQIWVAMWHRYSGQRLDGALAVDPTALSYLLRVTGPAGLPDGSTITSDNVVAVTQQTVYAKYPDPVERKARQLDTARALSRHLLGAPQDLTALLRAAGRASGERRLLAWSSDPAVEADLKKTALGGAVPVTAAPFVGLSINNAAANKLDFYLHASLAWRRTGCGTSRTVTVTMTIRNDAPLGLPAYVLGQTGQPGFPQRPGDNRLLVGYLATSGSALTAVTVEGRSSTAAIGAEKGHPVFTVDLALPRGATRVIVLTLHEPRGLGAPIVLRQPMVNPLAVSVDDARCR